MEGSQQRRDLHTQLSRAPNSGNSTWRWVLGCLPSFCHSKTVRDEPNIPVREAFRSVTILLKVFGLTYTVDKSRPGCFMSLSKLYTVAVLVGVNYNFWRLFAIYGSSDKFGVTLFQKILLHVYSWQILLVVLVSIFLVRKILPSLLAAFEDYRVAYPGVSTARMRRVAFRSVICMMVFFLLCMAASMPLVGDLYVHYYKLPFEHTQGNAAIYEKVLACLMQFYFCIIPFIAYARSTGIHQLKTGNLIFPTYFKFSKNKIFPYS